MHSMAEVDLLHEEAGSDDYAYFVYKDEAGVLMGEYVVPPHVGLDRRDNLYQAKGEVYRWQVGDDALSDLDLSDADIKRIASFIGVTPSEFRQGSPIAVYQAYGDYHGYINLDSYPLDVTQFELSERWPEHFGVDPDFAIETALEAAMDRMANEDEAAAWSTINDESAMELERMGVDDRSAVQIAEFGDSIAVNGDLLVWPHLYKKLGLVPSEHPQLWNEARSRPQHKDRYGYTAEQLLVQSLQRQGYEDIDRGGAVPGGSEAELDIDRLVSHVAQELGAPTNWVEHVFKEEWGVSGDKYIPWHSDSGDVTVYAKPLGRD